MANENQYRMSQQRYEELKAELEHMQFVEEKEVAEQIKEARSFGDLSENSEYDEAKNVQARLYQKIAEYKDLIEHAEIIQEVKQNNTVVSVGSMVTVCEDGTDESEVYKLVGSQEADPVSGKISEESPLGRSLLGHSKGDRVSFEAPDGMMYFTIINVEN